MNAMKHSLLVALYLCIPLACYGDSTVASDPSDDLSADEKNYQLNDNDDLIDNQTTTDPYSDDDLQQPSDQSLATQPTTGKSMFIFSPRKLRWYAYDSKGKLVGSGHASGGRDFCPDIQEPCRTPEGTFHIVSMGDESCHSLMFPVGEGGAPMPYCMHVNDDFSIHGSYDVPNYNASHGCIRVKPSVARWLRYNVLHIGSTVIVQPY
jgi:hypothetical protein